jgi:SOS-response transcriptional repressor LexA
MQPDLHKRLKLARIAAGFRSARHAAEALNIPYATYQAHESAKRNPSIAQVKAYAAAFRVSDIYLLAGGQAPSSNISAPLPSVRMVSIVSWASASNFAEAEAEYGENVPVPSSSSTLVALRVVGTSMDREAPQGSVIVVDYSQTFPVDKTLVVARRGAETTFKRYRDTEGPRRLEPASTDPSHQTIYDNGQNIEIIGRVIYIIRTV